MKANPIRFEIGSPRLAWSQINVTSGDFKWKFLASNSPWDSIAEFATAAQDLIGGKPTAQVRWNIDPGVFVFRFNANGDQTTFEILEFFDWDLRRSARREPIFRFEVATKVLVAAMWRCLRRLEGSAAAQTYLKEWRHPFPSARVLALTDALRRKK